MRSLNESEINSDSGNLKGKCIEIRTTLIGGYYRYSKMKNIIILLILTILLLGRFNSLAGSTIPKESSNDVEEAAQDSLTNNTFSSDIDTLDRFNEAIIQVEKDLQYFSQDTLNSKKYSLYDCVDPYLKQRLKECNDSNYEIDFNKIKQIKSSFIKAKKPFPGKLYLKVLVEEWRFENDTQAMNFKNNLDSLRRITREHINKGGIMWWRKNNNIYIC